MRNTMLGLALAGTCALGLTVSGCGSSDKATAAKSPEDAAKSAATVALPDDSQARAETCYAARVVRFSNEGDGPGLSVDQASEAAHFLLLGATTDGVTEPATSDQLQLRGKERMAPIRESGKADAYAHACAKAYPSTVKGRFTALAPDSPAIRTQCYSLAFTMIQVLGNSPQVGGPEIARYNKLAEVLDARIYAEAQAAGGFDPQKLLGEVKRALGTTVHLGPITEVLNACADRYVKS